MTTYEQADPHKHFSYNVFQSDKFAIAASMGFDLNVSDDGLWGIGDIGNDHVCEHCASELPSFASDEAKVSYAANGFLNQTFARQLTRTEEWRGE